MSTDESITSLSEAVAALGALPVPVGPEPQGREAAKARVRAKVEASRAMPARERIYHLLCATYTHAEAEAMLAEVDGRRELERLTARVAELEAERHSTNEALDDAVQALRASAELALPWAHVMPDGDLSGFLDDLVSAALNRWRTDPDGPVPDRVTLADIERVCREWRTPGVGYRSDPEPEAVPDAVTKVFSPVVSLREPEGEHWAVVHHSYRVPRDLPETGGSR